MKFPLRRFQVTLWLLVAFSCITTFCLPLRAKDLADDLFKKVQPPNSEWKVGKNKKWDKELGIKGKMPAVNIGVRIQGEMPISAANFLDQVRTKIIEDPGYQGAEVTLIQSQKIGGTSWNFFVIKRKDEVDQEFWARPFSSDQVLMVLYTAVGSYFGQYRNDFLQVLQEVGAD